MARWTFDDIPDQTGRVAVVTGANTGIGLETARMLAQKGAEVVLACRSVEKGEAAVKKIRALSPKGTVVFMPLDLSDLGSVEQFANAFIKTHSKLDLLVNNAGVMVPPLSQTKQGFELQFGTNHLGHFALAERLLPLLNATGGARVVVVSSMAAAMKVAHIDFDDLEWEKRPYDRWAAYCQSKLANSMFALELQRRLDASGSKVLATAAHPGWTATDLQRTVLGAKPPGILQAIADFFNKLLAMKPQDGALPTLRAATDPTAAGGSYWGPSRFNVFGPPVPSKIAPRALDQATAKRLWEVSEKLTGSAFPLPPRASLG